MQSPSGPALPEPQGPSPLPAGIFVQDTGMLGLATAPAGMGTTTPCIHLTLLLFTGPDVFFCLSFLPCSWLLFLLSFCGKRLLGCPETM